MGLFDLFTGKRDWLLGWQNQVCEDRSTKLYMSEKQLVDVTIMQVGGSIKIFEDSLKIIADTEKPNVFFSRLDLAEKHLTKLVSLEPYMKTIKQIRMSDTPSSMLRVFVSEKDRCIVDFLYRYYWSVKEKAEKMKTEKGKQNQYEKFYVSLVPYFNQINEYNMKIIDAMHQQKI